ncbi:MAG: 1-acyl-sn-glycerol-3-phosphate acyltransferase [Rhodobacteraceae bacterium]|nr:1-acyl-sn-glycerol-3-phosphate acyltransferase [Paracoccaceae bacterium]
MAYAFQWLRSLLFIGQMYVMMLLMGLFFLPLVLVRRNTAFTAIHTYTRWVRWTAGWMVGLKSEIRGEIPTDEVIVASKHQSFLDIIIIVSELPRPKFIMKKELKWAPILGFYANRINCIAVDRGKRGKAIKQMVRDVKSGRQQPGQLVIFPQGTRVAAGARKPYKVGTAVLHAETGTDVVPAATNVGVFWKRHGIYRYPGLAVVEFLPRITQGKSTEEFMAHLEATIENASDQLMREAGLQIKP